MELWLAFLRTYDVRLLLHCIFVSVIAIIKYGILGHKMGLNVTFGDGTPISVCEMHEIRSAIHKNMVFSRWQLGDIMCIDNFAVSHGRQPTYDHGRKVVVAWSNPLEKANTLTCIDAENLPADAIVMENPQERTPESTLTSEDAKVLKEAVLEQKLFLGGNLMSQQELEAALNRKGAAFKDSDSFGIHKRVHSQPVLLHPSSDFWKQAS